MRIMYRSEEMISLMTTENMQHYGQLHLRRTASIGEIIILNLYHTLNYSLRPD